METLKQPEAVEMHQSALDSILDSHRKWLAGEEQLPHDTFLQDDWLHAVTDHILTEEVSGK